MATDLRNLPAYLSDDADFRAWGSGLSAQLAAIGLVKTEDTGQINWLTVSKPSAINTFAGYEIWRFDDEFQATTPVFMKLEYGISTALDRPYLRPTVSTGTDGAGTPTGLVSTSVALRPNFTSKSLGVMLPSLCAGSPGRLNLMTHYDISNLNLYSLIFLERTKDVAGRDTEDGVVFYRTSSGAFAGCQIFAQGQVKAATSNPALNTGGDYLGRVVLSPTVIFLGKPFFVSWCVGSYGNVLKRMETIQFNHLGATRTYMVFGQSGYSSQHSLGGGTSTPVMLWE